MKILSAVAGLLVSVVFALILCRIIGDGMDQAYHAGLDKGHSEVARPEPKCWWGKK